MRKGLRGVRDRPEEGEETGTAARSLRSRESAPPPRPHAGLAWAPVRRERVPGALSPVSLRPSGRKGGGALKSKRNEKWQTRRPHPQPRNRQLKGEGLGGSAPDAGAGGLLRLGDPGTAEQPAAPGGRGRGTRWPRPAARPRAHPGRRVRTPGLLVLRGLGSPGRGARRRALVAPLGPATSPVQFPVRALSEALYSFFDLLMLIPRPDCTPLAPPPSWRAHHSFSVLIAVPPRIPVILLLLHLPSTSAFLATSYPRNLFRPGVPLRSQLSPFLPRDGSVCGSQCSSPRHERPAQSLA